MKTRHILITGGAGFIGRNLLTRLSIDKNNRIWVLDNLHPQVHGEKPAIPEFPDNVHFVLGDIRDKQCVESIVNESSPNAIYHLVSETGTAQSMEKIVDYCEVNVTGTSILLEAVSRNSEKTEKIILTSSRAIYGEGLYKNPSGQDIVPPVRLDSNMCRGEFDPVDANNNKLVPLATHEEVSPSPVSVYASTKFMQEQLLSVVGNIEPWNAVILRLQNVYGPGQSLKNPYTGVLSIFSEQLLSGKAINIYEDGNITRDFIYIDDVVSALIAADKASVTHATILNIGTGVPITILEVAKKLIGQYGLDKDSFEITGDYRNGDIRHAVAKINKAVELLDWKPVVDIDAGLKKLADWCRNEFSVR